MKKKFPLTPGLLLRQTRDIELHVKLRAPHFRLRLKNLSYHLMQIYLPIKSFADCCYWTWTKMREIFFGEIANRFCARVWTRNWFFGRAILSQVIAADVSEQTSMIIFQFLLLSHFCFTQIFRTKKSREEKFSMKKRKR